MIKLSEEQRHCIEEGKAVRVHDNGQEYVMLRPDVYERLVDETATDDSWTADELDRLREESIDLLDRYGKKHMKLKRGDVVMTRFPHAGGMRGKKRPALVVQADSYNAGVGHVIIAEITTNLIPANDPAFVLIDLATPEGKASGLDQNSLVSGLFLATIFEDRIDRVIGKLPTTIMQKVDACLKTALGLQ